MRSASHAAPLLLLITTLAGCSAPESKMPWSPHAEVAGLANGHQEVALYLTESQLRPTIRLECEKVLVQSGQGSVDFTLEGAVSKTDWADPQMDAWFENSKFKGAGRDGGGAWFPFVNDVAKSHRMFLRIGRDETAFCSLTSDSGAGFSWTRRAQDYGLEILTGGTH